MKLVLVAHIAATLFMAGVIWMVQVVHYPLFGQVGAEGFSRYANDHARLITFVVLPPMFIELGTAVALALRPAAVGSSTQAYVSLALIMAIWASTFLVQVPLHGRLAEGFDPQAIRLLVSTNWIRTALWSARAGLIVYWLFALLAPRNAV